MKITKLLLQLFLFSIVITSCSDNEKIVEVLKDEYTKGIIISAEGVFNDKDGSISYVNNGLTESQNFIYAGKNGALLGGLIQSITFTDTDAYIVLNDVNTIIITDRYTFEKKGQITTGLKNPRYMTVVNGKGYVTNWGDGSDINDDYLAIIDIATNTIEATTISLANGVEQILNKNNKLYVSHKGAFSTNNIISIVDLNASNTVSIITVNDNPDEMVFDNAGNLIVLSEGNTIYDASWNVVDKTTSAISFIDLSSNTISKKLEFPAQESAAFMTYQNGKVYYYKGADSKVYTIDESATVLATEGIDVGGIYGMNVRDNDLFTVSYEFATTTTLSKFKAYDLNTKAEVYSTLVGIGASKIYFNN